MPELPDLEVIKGVLRRRALGQRISEICAAGRSTSFCRGCQPGSMFPGIGSHIEGPTVSARRIATDSGRGYNGR